MDKQKLLNNYAKRIQELSEELNHYLKEYFRVLNGSTND